MRWILLALPLVLSACVAPSGCANPAARELARIQPLIVEVETALALGYRERRVAAVRREADFCRDAAGRLRSCVRERTVPRIERIAIDPAREQRVRANLLARRAALTREARARDAACVAAGATL